MTKAALNLFTDNPVLSRLLGDAVRLQRLDQIVLVPEADQADMVLEGENTYKLRLGSVLDWLQRRATALNDQKQNLTTVRLIKGDFLPRTRTYVRSDDQGVRQEIRLTDKERDILVALYMAPNRTVTKDDLLAHVWGYVSGLETHTLETHIYRLRQKIESDPKVPESLLTTDIGYQLQVRD